MKPQQQIERILKLKLYAILAKTTKKVRSLSLAQLELLGEALLDFHNLSDLESWFGEHSDNV